MSTKSFERDVYTNWQTSGNGAYKMEGARGCLHSASNGYKQAEKEKRSCRPPKLILRCQSELFTNISATLAVKTKLSHSKHNRISRNTEMLKFT